MSQLVLEVKSEQVKQHLLWFLQHFKKEELEILDHTTSESDHSWSDDYIEQHWKELIVTSSMQPDYESSESFKDEFGKYLAEKHK